MTERSGRLAVGLVGAGRVGAVLAAALGGAGHRIVAASAVSDASRERAETLLPGVPILSVPAVIAASDLVLLGLPTADLPGFVAGIADLDGWQPGQLVVHCAPDHGTGVLDPATRRGAIPLALHPILQFTGTSLDVTRLVGTWFGITAPAPVLPIAQALVLEVGGEPVVIAEEARPRYTEAVAVATSFSAAIVEQATGLLQDVGVPRPGAVLAPLIRSVVGNALARADPGADASPV